MSGITIEQVKDKKQFSEFLNLPWKIYKNDPYWVPLLISDLKSMFDKNKNPFFKHAEIASFLSRKNGELVGRIVAIIDRNHNEFHSEKTGFFGFFECINEYEIAKSLFDTAKKWVKEKGMTLLRGPTNFTTNDECAFLLEGFDSSPVIMMTYNPKYYLNLAEQYGFRKAKDLYALLKGYEPTPERILKLIERNKKRKGIVIRKIDMKNFAKEIEIIKDIYNSAWEKNWGFVPMTNEEIECMANKLKPIVVPELVYFAEIEGKPVAVSITVPDFNQVLKRINGKLGPIQLLKVLWYKNKITGIRSIVFGIKKGYRGIGIDAALYYATEIAGKKLGYKWAELSWNLEDNELINKFDMNIGGKIYKKYRIYEIET